MSQQQFCGRYKDANPPPFRIMASTRYWCGTSGLQSPTHPLTCDFFQGILNFLFYGISEDQRPYILVGHTNTGPIITAPCLFDPSDMFKMAPMADYLTDGALLNVEGKAPVLHQWDRCPRLQFVLAHRLGIKLSLTSRDILDENFATARYGANWSVGLTPGTEPFGSVIAECQQRREPGEPGSMSDEEQLKFVNAAYWVKVRAALPLLVLYHTADLTALGSARRCPATVPTPLPPVPRASTASRWASTSLNLNGLVRPLSDGCRVGGTHDCKRRAWLPPSAAPSGCSTIMSWPLAAGQRVLPIDSTDVP